MRAREGVISEEIDGEVIMIDLASGVYYSLRGTAVPAWQRLCPGATRQEVIDELAGRFIAGPGEIEQAVDQFLGSLQANNLLVEEGPERPPNASDAPSAGENGKVGAGASGGRSAFTSLEIERFDDMAHVIQLDPIHDIDPARGWPTVPD
jgi:hypothetical protein